MTDIQLYIDGQLIYTPPGFNLVFDQESPLMDLDTIITGGLAFDIRFPFGENQIIMQQAHRIDVASRKVSFPAMVHSKGELRVQGIFTLQTSQEDAAHQGMYRGNIISNDLALQLDNALSDLVTKEVSLGSTTASIIASAKAQNSAAMSTNGVSGAVMKFVPHVNPDFYSEDVNPDWYHAGDWYDPDKAYDAREFIKVQPSGNVLNPITYQAVQNTAAGEDPTSHAAKWKRRAFGILNAWDAVGGKLEINKLEFVAGNEVLNTTALVPFIQIMDVLRELAKAINFTLSGEFVNDTAEQRALMYSNYALDKRILQRCFAELELQAPAPPADWFTHLKATAKLPTADYDPLGLWSDVNHAFQTSDVGFIRFRIRGTAQGDGTAATSARLYFQIEDFDSTGTPGMNTTDAFQSWSAAVVNADPQDFDIEILYENIHGGAIFEQELWWYFRYDNTESYGTLTDVTVEVTHLTLEGLNAFSGNVRYADHVPDLSGAQFLLALRQWKNLHISFDMLSRNMQVDYADSIFDTIPTTVPAHLRIAGQELTCRERKRFSMQYAHLPAQSSFDLGEYDELDPVNSFADLPAPPDFLPVTGKAGKAALVKAENRYYITTTRERGGSGLEWVPGPHNYPKLLLNSEGDLVPIEPNVGPLPMGTALDRAGNTLTLPQITEAGRSASFDTKGQRPPLLITYWIGIDTSTIPQGYPLASTTGTVGDGTSVLPVNMDMATLYTDNWKRTLQMLVLEEIIKIYYAYHPELKKNIHFSKLLLIDHTPALPVRSSEMIGESSRSASGVEVEARKVKLEGIKIVSGEAEPEPEVQLWTPEQISTELWLDFADELTVVLEGGKISQVLDKSGNLNHAKQETTGYRPAYTTEAISGRKTLENNTSLKYLICQMPISTDKYTWIVHFNMRTYLPGLPMLARTPSLLGLHSSQESGALTFNFSNIVKPFYANGTLGTTAPFNQSNTLVLYRSVNANAGTYNFIVGADLYSNYALDGTIAEIIMYKGLLSDEIRQKLEGYLAWKHNTHSLLSVDHPYKLGPPTL